MYLEHFGLSEPAFTITPHTEFFFAGANRGATLEALIYAISHGEGIVKVSGEVGSGKTMLCRVLMERLPPSVETIYLAIPSLNRDEMLAAICADLGVKADTNAPNALLKALQEHLLRLHAESKRVVALIDEAHAMPLDSLEEIRLLSNLETNKSKLLQIVLFGQPELDENLAKPQMRQLRERITHSFRLSALTLEDVQAYLRHRLRAAGYRGAEVFSQACVKLIAKASEGLTRRVNIIADKSLLAAYSDSTHSVKPAHVQAAVRDSEFAAVRPRTGRRPWIVGVALAAGLIIGALGASWVLKRDIPVGKSQAGAPKPASVPVQPTPQELAKADPLASTISQANTATNVPDTAAEQPKLQVTPLATMQKQGIALVAAAAGLGDWLAASEPWLARESGANWVIQLTLANAAETLQLTDFIRESEEMLGAGRIHAYRLTVNGIQKVSIVYGSFATREAGAKALAGLPPKLRQFNPYLRSIQLIRNEAEHDSKSAATHKC